MKKERGITPAELMGYFIGKDGSPDGIERSERDGQKSFMAQQTLPINGLEQEKLEALGFIFGNRPVGDELFIACQFPDGWTKRPTEHSMWSELVSPDGKVVASMFYKAAFYDMDAFMVWRGDK